MSTTTAPDTRAHHRDHDPEVVRWPDPSPLRPWWDTVMGPAMRTTPAGARSPDPRHPRARNPHLPRPARTRRPGTRD
ncbi:hypothetical protein ABZ319_08960 [Nocardia sp. NPDC005978]|uniref:hypothetical protein n=1 Tax=Nocardia sp. NPDC005978 TaxID=3156725 RepID=UPI0033B6406F